MNHVCLPFFRYHVIAKSVILYLYIDSLTYLLIVHHLAKLF